MKLANRIILFLLILLEIVESGFKGSDFELALMENNVLGIKKNGQYYQICDGAFTANAARLACQKLAEQEGTTDYIFQDFAAIKLCLPLKYFEYTFDCTGKPNFDECEARRLQNVSEEICQLSCIGLNCQINPARSIMGDLVNWQLRLNYQIAEVFYLGKWQNVCDDLLTTKTATVFCRQLAAQYSAESPVQSFTLVQFQTL